MIAPEDLSKKGGYTVKVYLEAEILSEYGDVTLYGHDLKHSGSYENHDLSQIYPHTHGVRKSLKVYSHLFRTIIGSKFDYVFIPTVFHPLFPLLFVASKLGRSKIIYDFRDPLYGTMRIMRDEVNSRTGNKALSWLITKASFLIEAVLLWLSDYVLTVSPLLVDYVERFKGRSHNNIFLYYNYLPSDVRDIRDDALPEPLRRAVKEKIVICYLGHIQTAIRGIESIFQVLTQSTNKDVSLVLLGEIDNRTYWDSLIRELHCEEQILILEPRPKPDALGILKKCDYAILGPSPDNALPAKIFDTLSLGIKFILPSNMSSAIEVLGSYCTTYKDFPDLMRLLNNLKKPAKDSSPKQINEILQRYSLNSRLKGILQNVFENEYSIPKAAFKETFTH